MLHYVILVFIQIFYIIWLLLHFTAFCFSLWGWFCLVQVPRGVQGRHPWCGCVIQAGHPTCEGQSASIIGRWWSSKWDCSWFLKILVTVYWWRSHWVRATSRLNKTWSSKFRRSGTSNDVLEWMAWISDFTAVNLECRLANCKAGSKVCCKDGSSRSIAGRIGGQ